jgi:hypothetical protein
MNATYNITNNRLKFYIERRLNEEEYKIAKAANFQWWPGQKCFSAVWTPQAEDFILSFCSIDEDDTPDDLEARVNRFQKYAENDEKESEYAAQRANEATTTRRAEQAEHTAVKKLDEAVYWNRRIAGAIAHAQHKERRDVIARRIKGLEADKRKHEKEKKNHETFINLWNNPEMTMQRANYIAGYDTVYSRFPPDKFPQSNYAGEMSVWSALDKEIITPEYAQQLALEHHNTRLIFKDRWINHLSMLIDYERAYLEAIGGNPADKLINIKKGDYVTYRGERCEVLNTGKANFRILIPSNTWQKNGMLINRENCTEAK